MTKYVIHIGAPKTGTKYLQSHFRRHGEDLLSAGIYYPSHWWQSARDVNHDALLSAINAGDPTLEGVFSQFNESGHETILISCEGLCNIGHRQRLYLRALTGDSPVEIVFFCRRWSDWIPSAWQQSVKQGGVDDFPIFLAKTLIDSHRLMTINFEPMLGGFAEIFGKESIKLVSYSNNMDDGHDIADLFFQKILNVSVEVAEKGRTIHESVGVVVAELVRCLNVLESELNPRPGIEVFQRFEKFKNRPELADHISLIESELARFSSEVAFNDTAGPLGNLFVSQNNKYRSTIVGFDEGRDIFDPKASFLKYISTDYLLNPAITDAIRSVYSALIEIEKGGTGSESRARFKPRPEADKVSDLLVADGSEVPEFLGRQPDIGSPHSDSSLKVVADMSIGIEQKGGAFLLGEGWSKPEDHFTWTLGKHSTLRFRCPADAQNYRILLVVRPFVVPVQLESQRVSISVNGALIGSASVRHYSVLQCDLIALSHSGNDTVEVSFDLPDAARPAELSNSKDARELALCLERVVLLASAEAPEHFRSGFRLQ